ncbi:hypothetical protein SAMN02745673_01657 [Marinactinospora thermotolerans DSM 45154]|uniref:Uncharacterized protein n=2 Tax=Marinactinospora thermotolerans TaxID=531310 RepID=A0A1T4P6Q6_9ACTN|nr:hypothetical protein SAMN02745673_01657 [Marinactinospora thermotolerans DSM 45154]
MNLFRWQAVDLLRQPFCPQAGLAPAGLLHTESERLKAVRMQPGHGVRETGASVRFEVVLLAPDGTEERLPLEQAARYPFESVLGRFYSRPALRA